MKICLLNRTIGNYFFGRIREPFFCVLSFSVSTKHSCRRTLPLPYCTYFSDCLTSFDFFFFAEPCGGWVGRGNYLLNYTFEVCTRRKPRLFWYPEINKWLPSRIGPAMSKMRPAGQIRPLYLCIAARNLITET